MLPRLSLRPRAAPALAAHGPGRPVGRPPPAARAHVALAEVPDADDERTGGVGALFRRPSQADTARWRQKMPRGGERGTETRSSPGEPSSATTRATPATLGDGGPTGPGGTKSKPARLPRLVDEQRATPESVVHALLPAASHTSAREVLGYLERGRGLTPSAAAALDGWAAREGDERTRRRLRLACRAERVPFQPQPQRQQWTPGTRANKALWYRYTPIRRLPEHPSPTDFLAHQHYLLLASIAETSNADRDDATSDAPVPVAEDDPYSLATALTTVAALGGGGPERLAALHLALAYAAPRDVEALLDAFEGWHARGGEASGASTPTPAKPKPPALTRQTLHLSLLARLRARTSIDDVRALCARFKRTPGPESWRHVAQHALQHSDSRLAKLAFTRGKAELAAERATAFPAPSGYVNPFGASRAARVSAPSAVGSEGGGEKAGSSPLPAVTAAEAAGTQTDVTSASSASTSSKAVAPAAPRFTHLGRHTQRWEWTMHALAARGWVVRGPPVAQVGFVPRLIERWRWVAPDGPEPEADKKEYVPYVRAPRRRRAVEPPERGGASTWWPWRGSSQPESLSDHIGDIPPLPTPAIAHDASDDAADSTTSSSTATTNDPIAHPGDDTSPR